MSLPSPSTARHANDSAESLCNIKAVDALSTLGQGSKKQTELSTGAVTSEKAKKKSAWRTRRAATYTTERCLRVQR